ncbi:peptidoglycan-binding domain-containing protein [Streptomyces chryseus]|uniref:peptidoglycan-binding domain-containing protein n=1 Tax=Streptomyces chryseus TaxID=68186 RepID=UPI00110F8B7D|nr:peptidoglycan-binding domain-containing protein [Streptomyces chryseus]GGX12569.1 peptidoglycan-binding protein [Streptomyces chryseus]
MNGHTCPECGTDRGAASEDGRPGCGCAERAAEEFHPLRIRPYVTHGQPQAYGAAAHPAPGHDGALALTMPLEVPGAADPGARQEYTDPYDGADPAPCTGGAGATDDLYEVGSRTERSARRRERRGKGPALWLAAGAAVVAVVGVAGFAGGLFSGSEEQEFALPDVPTSAPATAESPRASETSATRTPSAGASPSPGSPGSSASVAVASATASGVAPAVATASGSADAPDGALAGPEPDAAASAPAPPAAQPSDAREGATEPSGAVLSRGDRGPEVSELQDRLAQARYYDGPDNGRYNDRLERAVAAYQASRGIEGDPAGTYGPHTRRALEAETREP